MSNGVRRPHLLPETAMCKVLEPVLHRAWQGRSKAHRRVDDQGVYKFQRPQIVLERMPNQHVVLCEKCLLKQAYRECHINNQGQEKRYDPT